MVYLPINLPLKSTIRVSKIHHRPIDATSIATTSDPKNSSRGCLCQLKTDGPRKMVLPKYYSDVHFEGVSIQALGWFALDVFFVRVEFLWTVGFYGINEYRGTYTIVPWILWGCKCCSSLAQALGFVSLGDFSWIFHHGIHHHLKLPFLEYFLGTLVQPPNKQI